MPAHSAAQKRLMDAAAHNPAFAKKVGIPTKVAKDFSSKSKGMTFKKGGEMKESKAMMKKEISFMKKKGAPKSMIKHEESEMKTKKYVDGGMAGRVPLASTVLPAMAARRAVGMKKGGSVAPSKMGAVKTAAPSRDGVATKGKTKGKMVTMRMGGKACK